MQPFDLDIPGDLPLGEIRYFQSLGSTNEIAAVWAQEGAPELSIIVADEQTAGKGRRERAWTFSLTPNRQNAVIGCAKHT